MSVVIASLAGPHMECPAPDTPTFLLGAYRPVNIMSPTLNDDITRNRILLLVVHVATCETDFPVGTHDGD